MTQRTTEMIRARLWGSLNRPVPDLEALSTCLVALGQGEYTQRYIQAPPVDEIEGVMLDALKALTSAASHTQAMASAAGCSLLISTPTEVMKDIQACAEYAELVIEQCGFVASLIEGGKQ